MAKQYAFIFPGQGAQSPGMLKDITLEYKEARDCLESASDIAKEDLKVLLWDTPKEILSRSDKSQLAILVSELATIRVLRASNICPSAVMGFSLGEFAALYSAGVLGYEDVIKVVQARGKIMQRVCEDIASNSGGKAPGMTAVLGLEPCKVLEGIKGIEGVYAANMNSPKQTVISGTYEGLKLAEDRLKLLGARRTVRLAVAGPYHSPLMAEAAKAFDSYLTSSSIEWKEPSDDIVLYSNVTGQRVTSAKEARSNAVEHLTSPVLWTSEEDLLAKLIEAKDYAIIEVGPGKVLTGLWRDMGYSLSCQPCNTAEGIKALVDAIGGVEGK